MKLLRFVEVRALPWRALGAACSTFAACTALLGCQGVAVRPTETDSSADNDVTDPSRADSSAADSATQASVCLSTAAPTCGDTLPEARMLYEFRSAPPAQAPAGVPAPGMPDRLVRMAA
jgi:hypothetical protein